METMGPAFYMESSYWSAFGGLEKFKWQKYRYDFGPEERAELRVQRMYQTRPNPLKEMKDPEQIRAKFRFYPDEIEEICSLVGPEIERDTKRNNSIPVVNSVCAALNYFGTGNDMRAIGDDRYIRMSKSSVCRCVDEVTQALWDVKDKFIRFPNHPDAISQCFKDFKHYCGLPTCIGAVDGTHVPIRTPTSRDAYQYINRKGVPTLNVGVVCSARNLITHINPCWPGSSHDSRVFKESDLYDQFEHGKYPGYLLGDSAYALRGYMMTPVQNPKGAETLYNISHSVSRVIIENTFGMWKGRFGILKKTMPHEPVKCGKIITATAVLHNFAVSEGDIWVEDGEVYHLEEHDEADNYHYFSQEDKKRLVSGKEARDKIIRKWFIE